MNVKWKVALLTLLGFSTAACCSTKKAAKSEEKTDDNITVEGEDPRIMLMYGVPFPDGRVAVPVDENGNPIAADENAEVVVDSAAEAEKGNVAFPDGREAAGITEEEAKKRIEEIKAAEAEANSEK
jgi:hypothetical protein